MNLTYQRAHRFGAPQAAKAGHREFHFLILRGRKTIWP
jgi:hypothetical protein